MSMAAVQVSLPLPLLSQDWSGEKEFKSIGQLSSATQRNIEPVGPHFLAHARRVSQIPLLLSQNLIVKQKRHQRTFSEDDRIQAQENVKKVEDDDVGEISEPEDPLMLQRDAKDWKVQFSFHMSTKQSSSDISHSRDKTTTPSLGSRNTATKLRKPRSSAHTVKKSFAITRTKKLPLVPPRMIPFSNAYKRPPKSSSTLLNVGNLIRWTRLRMWNLRPRSKRKRATSSSYGTPFSYPRAASARLNLFRG